MSKELSELLSGLGVSDAQPPNAEQWTRLLEAIGDRWAELDENRRVWQAIQSLPLFVIRVGTDLHVEAINRSVIDMTAEEVPGHHALEFIAQPYHDLVRSKIEACFATGEPTHYETRAMGPNGRDAWYDTAVGPITRDGEVVSVLLLSRDITEKKEAEDALRRSEADNRALLDAVPDLILRQRRDGTILDVWMPETFEPALSRQQLVGRNVLDLMDEHPDKVPDGSVPTALRLIEEVLETGQTAGFEYEIGASDQRRYCESRVARVNDDEVLWLVRDITVQREAEERLRRSEARTTALLDAIPDTMLVVSRDCICVECRPPNDADSAIPFGEIVGAHIDDVLPQELADRFKPVHASIRTGEVYTHIYDYQGRSLEDRITALDDELTLVMVRDVTERRRAERQLRRREALYANLFKHSTDGILLHDLDDRIVDANERARALFRCGREDLIGRRIAELYPVGAPREAREIAKRIGPDGVVLFETRFRRMNGETFVAEVSASVFDVEAGRLVQTILRDVTQRRRSEESLRAAKDEAENANRAKSQFFSNMSHELRTPLNAILGFGRVLARETYGPLNERQREYLRDIVHSGEHMLQLVNNLLDLRRLEERSDFVRAVPTSLEPLIDEAMAMVSPLVDERSHSLSKVNNGKLPLVLADSRAVVRVLVNLLSNAVKYTDPGGQIRVAVATRPGHLRIEVSDSGVGIAREHQSRIFNYFEQVGGGQRQPGAGTGIGLALCRELVERMGGAIGVRSQPDQGSTFYFTLPTAEAFGPIDDGATPHHEPQRGSR